MIDEAHERHEERRRRRARRGMKLSIILGVRNRAQYAKKAIRSIMVQDLHRDFFEVIVVDFGSEDDLKDYLEMTKYNNLKFLSVPQAKQYERARSFNIGAKHARHRILVFTEADLLFPKYALRLIRDQVIANEKNITIIQQKKLQKLETAVIIGRTYSDYAHILQKIDLEGRPKSNGCVIIERPDFDEIGGFDEDYAGESYEVVDFIDRAQQNGLHKYVVENFNVLHMWHNEFKKENEGYFWELLNRKRNIASPARNQNRKWGALVPRRPKVLFMLSPRIWEPGSICKHVGEFLHSYYEVEMCGARESLRGKTSRKYDIVYTIDWRLPREFQPNSRFIAGVFDYISWNDGVLHNVIPEAMEQRLQLFEAISVPCRDLKEIISEYHPNTFHTPVAVDTEVFRPLLHKRRVSNSFTVGWVGKEEKEHTVEGYLEHIKPICNLLPETELFSAPGGEDTNGPTQMLGFYNAIDVLVMFDETKGDCKTILEAMACGVPVVTTRVSDVHEIIESNANGIIIPRNEKALTEALIELREKKDYRLKMGQLARATVVKHWDWRDKVHYWKQLFDAVMEIK
jgi:glycosyltransferase involved in cell wall biosynthesis